MKITQIILVDDSGKKYELDVPKNYNTAILRNIQETPIFIDDPYSVPFHIIRDSIFTMFWNAKRA